MKLDEIKETVKSRIDIVALAGEYGVVLKPSRGIYKALCPFHQEKSPSFKVYPETNSFHCFGCNRGGDVIRFFQLIEDKGFMDSLSHLAGKIGLSVGRNSNETSRVARTSELERLFYVVYAMGRKELLEGRAKESREVMAFLSSKGFSADDLQKIEAAVYTPRMKGYIKKKFSDQTVKKSGLGRWGFGYNYLLLIPHYDMNGKITGMIARLIREGNRPDSEEELPKYNFSPGFDLKTPFNFFQARKYMSHSGEAFAVEGPLDVFSMKISGYLNVIGLNGNRLMEESVELVRTAGARNLFWVGDADERGREGAEKDIRALIRLPWLTTFFTDIGLEDIKDPNDFFNPSKGGKKREDFDNLRAVSEAGAKWLANRLGGRADGSDPSRERAIDEGREIYSVIADPVGKEDFLKTLARRLRVQIKVLREKYDPGSGSSKSKVEESLLFPFLQKIASMIEAEEDLYKIELAAKKTVKECGQRKAQRDAIEAALLVRGLAQRLKVDKLTKYVKEKTEEIQNEQLGR